MKGIRLALGQHVSHAHLTGSYELDFQQAIQRHIRPGMVCYDLGASIGYMSLLMAGSALHVFCFEPSPSAASQIPRHMAANSFANFTVVPKPVSNVITDVTFQLTDVAYGSSIAETGTSRWPTISLTTTTIDTFAADHPAPDFIKIDIEGFEGPALAGAQHTLATKRPILCIEVHSNQCAEEVAAALAPHNYQLFDVHSAKPFSPADGTIIAGEVQIVCIPL